MRNWIIPGFTALVVDDLNDDRTAVSSSLESLGCHVFQAASYSEAMALFDLNRPVLQILIAAVALPDGNGCALAMTMRNQKPELRVLFMSHRVGAEACKYYGLKTGDIHFLSKPFSQNSLIRHVGQVFRSAESFPALNPPKTFTSAGTSSR